MGENISIFSNAITKKRYIHINICIFVIIAGHVIDTAKQ